MMQGGGNPNGGSNFRGGRGRGRGRGGGRGYSGGRSNTSDQAGKQGGDDMERPAYNLCKNFSCGAPCHYQNSCRFIHGVIGLVAHVPAHEKAIKSIAMLSMGDGPRLLSGSEDGLIKVWNVNSVLGSNQQTPEATLPQCAGPVQHVEINGTNIMWSVDEPIQTLSPNVPVGMVHYLVDPNNLAVTIPIKKSDDFPYTHPQKVRRFLVAEFGGVNYVITGGGEGQIRIWRFDPTASKFELLSSFDGHIREVTCLYLQDTFLWSGSLDQTIRVWDINSGQCLGVIREAENGHSLAISCFEFIAAPVAGQESYMASGGADGEVKLWKTNGEFVFGCNQGGIVTAMKCFQDTFGGVPALIIGLNDGKILIRSCASMKLLISLDPSFGQQKAIWSVVSLGQSCFVTGGVDGALIFWRIDRALNEEGQ